MIGLPQLAETRPFATARFGDVQSVSSDSRRVRPGWHEDANVAERKALGVSREWLGFSPGTRALRACLIGRSPIRDRSAALEAAEL